MLTRTIEKITEFLALRDINGVICDGQPLPCSGEIESVATVEIGVVLEPGWKLPEGVRGVCEHIVDSLVRRAVGLRWCWQAVFGVVSLG